MLLAKLFIPTVAQPGNASPPASDNESQAPMPRVILAVEDDEPSRDIVAILLRHLGYEVLEADSHAAAIRLLEHRPDLVLLDLELPDGDGWQLAHVIRTQSATPSVPIIVLSSVDRPSLMPVEISAYMQKPADISALKGLVESVVGPPDPGPALTT